MRQLREMKTRLVLETTGTAYDRGQRRAIVIEAEPGQGSYATVRLKGTRQRLPIPYETIYRIAVEAEVRRVKRERDAAKAAKKGGR